MFKDRAVPVLGKVDPAMLTGVAEARKQVTTLYKEKGHVLGDIAIELMNASVINLTSLDQDWDLEMMLITACL